MTFNFIKYKIKNKKGGSCMEKKTKEIQNNGMVKVVLRCGRNMSSEYEYNYSDDGCGGCEDATSNQTVATCC